MALLWGCGSSTGNPSPDGGAQGGAPGSGGGFTSTASSGGHAGSGHGGGGAGPLDAGTDAPAPALDACTQPALRVVSVTTAAELAAALADAKPGDRIELADGTYAGEFSATASGTDEHLIALCGTRKAILQGESTDNGYGFHLEASHWALSGFTVTRSQKGVILDGANQNLLYDLEVFDIGDEAIHLRAFSRQNTVQKCLVHDTGKRKPGFGEGIYLGSASSNWGTYSGGEPDTSDENQVLDNHIGPNVTAEHIDVKEGTTGGIIRGNVFDGHGMSGENYADSWIDVKGNGYLIQDNQGDTAILDGFQTHVAVDGWGQNTTFSGNAIKNVPGYGINVDKDSTGTVVQCNNTVDANAMGLSNVTCQ
ncbi:Parallel beta-helix repeat protein [Minicystis rosea]|nr:Parallel beta-helix repeat protein [Minicystis rosea]